MGKRSLLFLIALSCFSSSYSQTLAEQITSITKGKNASVSISAIGIEKPFSFHSNETRHQPMLSVFKFPIALHVLSLVDQGLFKMDTPIFVRAEDLLENTWSPLKLKYPNGNITLTLKELLDYAVAQSDNNACDILLRLVKGPTKTQHFIRNLGITEFKMRYNEAEMHENWTNQYKNSATTKALTALLKCFYEGKILSFSSTKILYEIMLNTKTGTNKIKAFLPIGSTAHKTGSSGKNNAGLTAAENDIGIITMPNGTHLAVAILISDSMESEETNTKMISEISKHIYDAYTLSVE